MERFLNVLRIYLLAVLIKTCVSQNSTILTFSANATVSTPAISESSSKMETASLATTAAQDLQSTMTAMTAMTATTTTMVANSTSSSSVEMGNGTSFATTSVLPSTRNVSTSSVMATTSYQSIGAANTLVVPSSSMTMSLYSSVSSSKSYVSPSSTSTLAVRTISPSEASRGATSVSTEIRSRQATTVTSVTQASSSVETSMSHILRGSTSLASFAISASPSLSTLPPPSSSSSIAPPIPSSTYQTCQANINDCKNDADCYVNGANRKICVCSGDYYGPKCEKEANSLYKPLVYAFGGSTGFLLLVICIALIVTCRKNSSYRSDSRDLDNFNNIGLRAKGTMNDGAIIE